jgi:hypothetical protein
MIDPHGLQQVGKAPLARVPIDVEANQINGGYSNNHPRFFKDNDSGKERIVETL